MRIALALIVKGTNEEAKLLDRCLASSAEFVDQVFITRTHLPDEKPSEAVAIIASKYKAILSDFEWIHDFSAARNFNFSQVSSDFDWILWSDADDIWRGLENLRPLLEENPHMDAFGMNYLYDWDEFKLPTVVHRKTMLVKNDGCVTWVGALHEDLAENRALEVHLIENIERLHLTTGERAAANAKRNVEIAEKEIKTKAYDPRAHWNLANSCFGVSDYDGARTHFQSFIELSESEDEIYLAHMRLGDVEKALGDQNKAVKQLQQAIGVRPSLPDAYFQLAHLYFSYNNWDKAEEYCLQGLIRRPQTHKMIVYNPRDYDYNPMMLLARVYYEKNRPDLMLPLLKGCSQIYPKDEHLKKLVEEGTIERDSFAAALEKVKELELIEDKEELRKAINELPLEVKSHPAVAVIRNRAFIKETSSGKDLVIYCGNTHHQWNPELFKTKGVGGSEEAVIYLAREYAKLGWNVTVYNNCGNAPVVDGVGSEEGVTDGKNDRFGLIYKPFWEFNYRDKQDVVILWRWAKPLDANINCDKIFIDLHDVIPDGEFTEKRLEKVTKVFVKTQFHRSLFPSIPDNKIVVVPNGMDMSLLETGEKKDPMLVINTSSPDRSMDVLPKLWERVKEQVPGVKFQWAYGWDVYKAAHANDPKKTAWMNETIKEMEEAGIEMLGKLPQSEVGKLYQRASFLAYPSEFAEIDCISVKKAQAAKCAVVATDFGAFPESIKYGVKVHSEKTGTTWNRPYQFHFGLENEEAQDAWVNWMVELLTTDSQIPFDGLDEWKAQYEWSEIARRWNEELCK